jgi:hypothetical protein
MLPQWIVEKKDEKGKRGEPPSVIFPMIGSNGTKVFQCLEKHLSLAAQDNRLE